MALALSSVAACTSFGPSASSRPAAPSGPDPIVSSVSAPDVFQGDVRALPRSAADPNAVHPEGGDPGDAGGAVPRGGPSRAPDVSAADATDQFTPANPNVQGINGGNPPDPTGDVGPNHYVEMVNTNFAIFDKAGNTLVGSTAINSLWTGAGGQCEVRNDGDPIVVYDQEADRFLLSQFINDDDATPHFGMCIAISRTGDPVNGGFFLYEFATTVLPDYPKFGVWPDAYYMSSFEGTNLGVFAFDRTNMLAGNAATFQRFTINALTGGRQTRILPADWDGAQEPPAGAPNPFVRSVDGEVNGGTDRLEVFEFHVDFAVPANSTFTMVATLATAAFDTQFSDCFTDRLCVPQPNTTQEIDNLSNRLMWRLQYRNFGTFQTLVVNQTVDFDATDRSAVRWYELRNVGTGWTIRQQADFSPDADNRFMGSIAMNGAGDIAVGYTVSSGTVFPSVRYTGRRAADPLNTLPQGETTLIAGTASQTGSARWGDYTQMAVDPVDDCTFWYVGQFADTTSSFRTRIGAMRFPESCRADLRIAKTDSPDPVSSGNPLTYTVTVTNDGPADATDVVVTDVVPATASVQSVVPSQGTCSVAGTTVTCNLGTLARAATATVTITVRILPIGTVTNRASVTSAETDPNPANNSVVVTTVVQPLPVAIDIKPGSDVNPVNLKSRGVIPVAILSSATFDATTVQPLTVCFGDAENVAQRDCTEAHGRGHVGDVDGDGDADLVLHFDTQQTGIDVGDTRACLIGTTRTGVVVGGCDTVRVR